MIAISGDNRNDYTRIDRTDIYDPDSTRIEVNDDEALLMDDQDLFEVQLEVPLVLIWLKH